MAAKLNFVDHTWNTQPPAGIRLDKTHPFVCKNTILDMAGFSNGQLRSLVTSKVLNKTTQYNGDLQPRLCASGPGFSDPTNGGGFALVNLGDGYNPVTLFSVFHVDSMVAGKYYLVSSSLSGSISGIGTYITLWWENGTIGAWLGWTGVNISASGFNVGLHTAIILNANTKSPTLVVDGRIVAQISAEGSYYYNQSLYNTGYSSPTFGTSGSGTIIYRGLKADYNIESALNFSANPWGIFEPDLIPLFKPVVTAQYSRPTSDASTGTWTSSLGGSLYAAIDETVASDTDYITTTNASTCEVGLSSLSDPASSAGHIVRYRISATSGGITVRLRQGTTTIATWTHATAPTSLTTYSQTLTSGEADSITDYTTLRLQFEAT